MPRAKLPRMQTNSSPVAFSMVGLCTFEHNSFPVGRREPSAEEAGKRSISEGQWACEGRLSRPMLALSQLPLSMGKAGCQVLRLDHFDVVCLGLFIGRGHR